MHLAGLIAERLRTARTLRRMTIVAVARAIGRSRETIATWESGRAAPSAGDLHALVELYGCSADWILARDATTGFVAVIDAHVEARVLSSSSAATWRAGIVGFGCLLHSGSVLVTSGDAFYRRARAVLEHGAQLQEGGELD